MTSQTLTTRILITLLLFLSGITTVGITWSAAAPQASASVDLGQRASNDEDDQSGDDQDDNDDGDDDDGQGQDDDNDGD